MRPPTAHVHPEADVQLIVSIIEILLVASGLFFLTAALLDGPRATRRAGEPDVAHPAGARGPATLMPRTIQRTALD